jgi:hypothetical protein
MDMDGGASRLAEQKPAQVLKGRIIRHIKAFKYIFKKFIFNEFTG